MSFENLVPKEKKNGIGKSGTTPYEVLVYHTQHECLICDSEPKAKKHIVAKFRDYDESLAYAESKAKSTLYHRVILRA